VCLPPPDPAMTPAALEAFVEEFFAGVGSRSCKVDASRHPLMHVTPTTDYIMLLSGVVSLLLDEGDPIPLKPFDCVIQRATNHAWIVTGDEPAVFLAVMAGRERA
jgi:cupin domain